MATKEQMIKALDEVENLFREKIRIQKKAFEFIHKKGLWQEFIQDYINSLALGD